MFLQPQQPRRGPEQDKTGLAVRAATLAIVAAVLFGVLLFRLWALQVLRSDHYIAQAQSNEVREIAIPAQRGRILDSAGRTLVDNVGVIELQIDPSKVGSNIDCASMPADAQTTCSTAMANLPIGAVPLCKDLPEQARCEELSRLARKVLKRKPASVWNEYEKPLITTEDSGLKYVIDAGPAVTVSDSVTEAQVAYVLERRDQYPGVQFLRTYERRYPFGPLAANVLGYTGQISQTELNDPNFAGLPNDAVVGQAGVEYTYDQFLRGQAGVLSQSFDAAGRAVGQPYMVTPPIAGSTVKLTIDGNLQRVAQKAIVDGINLAHSDGETGSSEGAVVAMDPKTGALLALASYPTYNPTVWVKQGKPLQWLLNPNNAAHPQFDRATQGQYPPGSTFKPFTAASGYEAGLIGTNTHLLCSGTYTSPIDQSKTVFRNWDTGISAVIDLPKALEISCDSFFYRIGNAFYERYTHASEQFPVELRKFGFGAAPPIDITGAALGVVPDPQWKERTFTDSVERLWSPGDDINMSIGQGNLLVSPLQLATAYSAVATDGTLPTPHVVAEATDPSGHTKHFHFQPQRHLALSSTFLDEVRQGLIGASHASDGTSTSVFGSFLPEVAGKTGTAEAPPKDPNAWYACWAPANDPKIVVVVLIANGGHGGVAAAPAAREVLQAYFHPNAQTTLVHGTDTSH